MMAIPSPERKSAANWAMKSLNLFLFGAALGGLFNAVKPAFAQSWTLTTAPITNWHDVASSADGSKLEAVVNGGVWVSQTPPTPHLNITISDGIQTLSWTLPLIPFQLQPKNACMATPRST